MSFTSRSSLIHSPSKSPLRRYLDAVDKVELDITGESLASESTLGEFTSEIRVPTPNQSTERQETSEQCIGRLENRILQLTNQIETQEIHHKKELHYLQSQSNSQLEKLNQLLVQESQRLQQTRAQLHSVESTRPEDSRDRIQEINDLKDMLDHQLQQHMEREKGLQSQLEYARRENQRLTHSLGQIEYRSKQKLHTLATQLKECTQKLHLFQTESPTYQNVQRIAQENEILKKQMKYYKSEWKRLQIEHKVVVKDCSQMKQLLFGRHTVVEN